MSGERETRDHVPSLPEQVRAIVWQAMDRQRVLDYLVAFGHVDGAEYNRLRKRAVEQACRDLGFGSTPDA